MISDTRLALSDAHEAIRRNGGALTHQDAQTLKSTLETHLQEGAASPLEVAHGLGAFLQHQGDAFEQPQDSAQLRGFAQSSWNDYVSNRNCFERFLDNTIRDADGDGIQDGRKPPFGL